MVRKRVTAGLVGVALVGAVGSGVLATQDRFGLRAPNGISFGEFRGYETWQFIAPSVVEDGLKVIAGNAAMISAYKSGIPQNGKPFPDGAAVVKIAWSKRKQAAFPEATEPDTLKTVSFIVKDSRRFPETSGWGYAQFTYQPASNSFTPYGADASFGKTVCYPCHTKVAARDFIFTSFPVR